MSPAAQFRGDPQRQPGVVRGQFPGLDGSLIRCVVFDLDDTLALERDYVRSGFEAVGGWARRKLGVHGLDVAAWRIFEAGGRGDTIERALMECGGDLGPEVISSLVRVYRFHAPRLSLPPDAQDCLDRLRGRVACAMISDGPLESQSRKVAALGLRSRFFPIVLTGRWRPEFSKPHPRAFAGVERAIGWKGASLVYVADNPAKDFQAPKALGWRTVRVRRPLGLHSTTPNLPDAQPDTEVEKLSRLPEMVGV